jgi:sporulation protein YlmC with PRC-barrel domain
MEVEFGAKVIDRNGKVLGAVAHLMRNTWNGEITKFAVPRVKPECLGGRCLRKGVQSV